MGTVQSVAKPASPSPMTAPSNANATTLTAEVPRSIPRVNCGGITASDMQLQHARDLIGSLQGTIDVRIGVRERNEQILEGARME